MSGVLCIDFGTSSIRAVRRQPGGKLKPLDIGRVTKSRLDDASIRSEIHIDGPRKNVRFGERAFVAQKSSDPPAFYEASPKLWMREPGRLAEPAVEGLGLSRQDLLIGLLAYAIRAAAEADGIGPETLKRLDVRIAHPVWPAQVKQAVDGALVRICGKARQVALEREWGSITGTITTGVLRECTSTPGPEYRGSVDVSEPVAAAVELLPSEENLIRMCAVVDVGAGTTDLGLFLSLVPDSSSQKRARLHPIGAQVSLFQAGNQIDAIVMDLLKARAAKPSALALADVTARIRGIKETLFRNGFVQELGADVQLEDLQGHVQAKAMARDIRAELEKVIRGNADTVNALMNRKTHPIQHLDLVLAGGGATIDFLRRAIEKPMSLDGKHLPIRVTTPTDRARVNTYGASRGRMAVALGGASDDYDTLQHEAPIVKAIRYGSL